MKTERINTVVIGGGQTGLTAAAAAVPGETPASIAAASS